MAKDWRAVKRTGIFFHYQEGERLRDFPQALDGILDKDNVFLFDAFYPSKPSSSFDLEPLPKELLYQVHTPEMVERGVRSGAFEGALFSAAGTVAAAIRIWRSEIDNAFVFTGYGDHHAGRHSFEKQFEFGHFYKTVLDLYKTPGSMISRK